MGALVAGITGVFLVAVMSWERLMFGPVGPANLAVWISGLVVVLCVVTGRWVDEPLRRNLPIGAYRIVRESLTNIGKHAHGATQVTVRVVDAPGGGIDIEVTEDGHPGQDAVPGGGFGLVGLSERLEELGGTLQSGPLDGKGWRVKAHLPAAAA